jgi:D-alanyl-D-alanine carboxypeptidase (penicillin-binding protein 5/6)
LIEQAQTLQLPFEARGTGVAATETIAGPTLMFPARRHASLARCILAFAALVFGLASASAQANPNEFAIKAKRAILIDADSGAVLFQHNPDELMPPASMSKLMTLAVAFRALKAGQIKPEDEFLMSESAWRRGGAPSGTSAMMVPLNTRIRVDELIKGIVIQSGNDAAIAIAEGISGSEDAFARRMTEEARALGLTKSTFRNATGLYDPGHLMTARELAILGRYIIREFPEQYAQFSTREFRYRTHRFINRNPLLFMNIGADGLKTGFIKEAGYGIVGSAKQDNRRLIVVVNGLATDAERKEEARRLLEWGFRSFGEFKLFEAGDVIGKARVWGGDRMFLPLIGNGELSVVLPRFPANQKLSAEIVYKGPLKAPIKKGDPVAKLRVTSSSSASTEVQLYAAEDVQPSSKIRRGLDTLLHMAIRWIP